MKTVDAKEFDNRFGSYLQMTSAGPVFIEKTQQPCAVLLSYEEYERLKAMENAYWAEKASQAEADGYVGETESLKFIETITRAET